MTPLFWIALVAVGWLAMLLVIIKWIQGAMLEIDPESYGSPDGLEKGHGRE